MTEKKSLFIYDDKVLFIYDKDNTLEVMAGMAYAIQRQLNPKLSFSEFRTKNKESHLMLPGMADVIKHTAKLGNNILISGGNPLESSCNELRSLFLYFKTWNHKRKPVPFGQAPKPLTKSSPEVAESLRQNFMPKKIIVFGDSEEEYMLAKNIKADVLFLRAPQKDLLDKVKDIPEVYPFQTAANVMEILNKIFDPNQSRKKLDLNFMNKLAKKDSRS